MASGERQGQMWSVAPHDWAELQEPFCRPLWQDTLATLDPDRLAQAVQVNTASLAELAEPLASPNLTIENLGSGSHLIRCNGVPGKTYRIQYTEVLSTNSWQNLISQTTDASGSCQYTDTPTNGTSVRFYRSIYP